MSGPDLEVHVHKVYEALRAMPELKRVSDARVLQLARDSVEAAKAELMPQYKKEGPNA